MNVCVDTGFFIALYDESDSYHQDASMKFVEYFGRARNQLLVPWPILYETFRTKFVRRRDWTDRFRRDWTALHRARQLTLIDDSAVRLTAVERCLVEPGRALSLADRVMRALLVDRQLRIDYFVTYNRRDFADVCWPHGRARIP